MFGDTIGNWTQERLARFIAQAVHSLPLPKAVEVDTVKATQKLEVDAELVLSPQAIAYLKKQLGL